MKGREGKRPTQCALTKAKKGSRKGAETLRDNKQNSANRDRDQAEPVIVIVIEFFCKADYDHRLLLITIHRFFLTIS